MHDATFFCCEQQVLSLANLEMNSKKEHMSEWCIHGFMNIKKIFSTLTEPEASLE